MQTLALPTSMHDLSLLRTAVHYMGMVGLQQGGLVLMEPLTPLESI